MSSTAKTPARDDQLDRELLRLVASGDTRSLEHLYLEYHRRLLQFLSRLSSNREALEEAVNDTFWIVWQKANEFRGGSRVSTWIMGIAWRCAMKALRRNNDSSAEAFANSMPSEPAVGESLVGGGTRRMAGARTCDTADGTACNPRAGLLRRPFL